jgi:hypothetical protein
MTSSPMTARPELGRPVDDWFDVWDRGDGAYFETEAEPYLALDILLHPSFDSDVATLDDEEDRDADT